MNKKVLAIVGVILVVAIVGVIAFFKLKEDEKYDIDIKDKKILVVYYSAQNHTETVAKKIAEKLDADVFKIEAVNPYSEDDLNYHNKEARCYKEHDDESLRDIELISTNVENWDEYDIVLIGYPIWWGIAAWPVNNFIKDNNFEGKTIIPFCTSGSSGLGESGKLLSEMAGSGNWLTGKRFSSNASDDDITNWVNNIKSGK